MHSINRNTAFFAVFLEFRKHNQCLSTSNSSQYKRAFIGWAEFMKYHLWCMLDEKISMQTFSCSYSSKAREPHGSAGEGTCNQTWVPSLGPTLWKERINSQKLFSALHTTHTYTNTWMNKCMKIFKCNRKHVVKC